MARAKRNAAATALRPFTLGQFDRARRRQGTNVDRILASIQSRQNPGDEKELLPLLPGPDFICASCFSTERTDVVYTRTVEWRSANAAGPMTHRCYKLAECTNCGKSGILNHWIDNRDEPPDARCRLRIGDLSAAFSNVASAELVADECGLGQPPSDELLVDLQIALDCYEAFFGYRVEHLSAADVLKLVELGQTLDNAFYAIAAVTALDAGRLRAELYQFERPTWNHLEAWLIMRRTQSNRATPLNAPAPASVSTPDGPLDPNEFIWQGASYAGFPRMSWRLLKELWDAPRRRLDFAEVGEKVFGADLTKDATIRSRVCRLNEELLTRGLPLTVRTQNEHVVLEQSGERGGS